ncbi:MAG: hypothetical protein HQK52_09215 [Oligoflexia bacterium]|nr:hypothetical protein [Oligoflexia bacterium]
MFVYKIAKIATKSLLIVLVALSMQQFAYAEMLLPMYNYKLPFIKGLGNKLYPGVMVNTTSDGNFYVQPTTTIFYEPSLAEVVAKDKAVSVAANCPVVKIELDNELALAQAMQGLINILKSSEINLDQKIIKQAQASGQCSYWNTIAETKQEVMNVRREALSPLVIKLQLKEADLQTCKILHSAAPTECDPIRNEIQSLKLEIVQLNGKLQEAITEWLQARQSGAPHCASAASYLREINEITQAIAGIRGTILTMQNQVSETIIRMGEEYGGSAGAVISNHARKQQEELERANPGYIFRPIDAKKVYFHFLPEAQDWDKTIRRRTVIGVAVQGATTSAGTSLTDSFARQVVSGNGGSAVLLTLSRLGACSDKLVRAAGFNYEYNAYSYLKGAATYNKWATYTKIESTKRTGGFLSSKTVHDLYEDMRAGQGFSFALETDDPNVDAEAMKEAIRQRLLNQILTDWAMVAEMSNGGSLTRPGNSAHGAQVLADGVLKVCPHIYCVAGALVLKTLDAIFGSDVAREDVKKIWDVKASERFAWNKVYTHHGSSSTLVTWR